MFAPVETAELIAIKKGLLTTTVDRLEQSLQQLEQAMSDLKTSAGEETKSSAGDKYETGRAMIHLELEKLSSQMNEHLKALAFLRSQNVERFSESIQTGALAETSFGNYFFLVNGGEVKLKDISYRVISLASPLGKALRGHTQNQEIQFNNRTISILKVY